MESWVEFYESSVEGAGEYKLTMEMEREKERLRVVAIQLSGKKDCDLDSDLFNLISREIVI